MPDFDKTKYIRRPAAAKILDRELNTLAAWPKRYPGKLQVYKRGREVWYLESDVIKLSLITLMPE